MRSRNHPLPQGTRPEAPLPEDSRSYGSGEIDSVKKMNEVVSLSDALMLALRAWEKVTPNSISNSWKHGGFWAGPMAKSQDEDYDSAEDDDEML